MADIVVGKAIALLCIYAKIKAVYATTLSQKAKEILEKSTVFLEWENLVEKILNTNKAETCPFERLAMKIPNPNDAYRKLKVLQDSLKT